MKREAWPWNFRHGESRYYSAEYAAWLAMRQRCLNQKCHAYSSYGERDITICERWNSFEAFLADMGRKPTVRHSLDRIDNNGNYESSNCRWRHARSRIGIELSAERSPAEGARPGGSGLR